MRALYLATVANRVMPAPTPLRAEDLPSYGVRAENERTASQPSG